MPEDDEQLKQDALSAHKLKKGKIAVVGKVAISDSKDLDVYYTPGVSYPCLAINKNVELSYEYTNRANLVAIITDGTRILGLGNIGPEAGMPVMEGKSLLMKKFGGVDAVPLDISAHEEDEIVKFVKYIEPSFGAINLEDLESPKCINILHKLENTLSIPVFHDDSYGTGIVTYAALINALKLVGKKLGSVKIVINGSGAAGYGIANLLHEAGAKDITMCDTKGIIYNGRKENMDELKDELVKFTNKHMLKGGLTDAVSGSDVLIGVSHKDAFNAAMIRSMNDKAIVFALANPDPEISYKDAKAAGAAIVATGRSDAPNQVNNLLVFPGVFRGILDCRASRITNAMMIAAGNAIARSVGKFKLRSEYIVPSFADKKASTKTTIAVSEAIAKAAMSANIARVRIDTKEKKKELLHMLKSYAKIEKLIGKS